MGQMVIAAYKPREGKDGQLLDLLREHLPTLRGEGLVTDRPSTLMRAANGAILEIFEWKSVEAKDEAHKNEAVQAIWWRLDEVCEFESLSNLAECRHPFP